MNVVISPLAERHLTEIADFIARDDPHRAVSFIGELTACCHGLVDMPRAFPLVAGHEQSGLRRRKHGRYLIFYRVSSSRIEIAAILHAARDYEALLFGEHEVGADDIEQ